MQGVNLRAYLERIHYTGSLEPTLETLNAIQRAHLHAIPYENLDIHLGRTLTLDPQVIYQKIVLNGRGGWCYEMNSLLGWALQEMGFQVTYLASSALRPNGAPPLERDHLVLLVRLSGEDYLTDTGFGDGGIEPLPLREGRYTRGFLEYGIERDGQGWIMRNHPKSNTLGFAFTTQPRSLEDFAERCTWLQTSKESGFVRVAVCQMTTADAIKTLRGVVFSMLTSTGETRQLLETANAFDTVLCEQFNLVLPEAETLWNRVWARHLEWLKSNPVS